MKNLELIKSLISKFESPDFDRHEVADQIEKLTDKKFVRNLFYASGNNFGTYELDVELFGVQYRELLEDIKLSIEFYTMSERDITVAIKDGNIELYGEGERWVLLVEPHGSGPAFASAGFGCSLRTPKEWYSYKASQVESPSCLFRVSHQEDDANEGIVDRVVQELVRQEWMA
jgi:hypothetical protein